MRAAALVWPLAALGLVMVALGHNVARSGGDGGPLFWGGLIVVYAPLALRLFSVSTPRAERIAVTVLLGGALYLVKVIYNPTEFTLHDELATWLQTHSLLVTGQPLGPNTLVSGYAGFPGLASFTAALAASTGSGIFVAASIVIGLARLCLMVGLFLLFERVSGSARIAGIATAVYAANPSFLYFDSQFGYESLALAVAAGLLLLAHRWARSEPGDAVPAVVVGLTIVAATLAVTHHMTSYAVVAFLALWAVVIRLTAGGTVSAPAAGSGRRGIQGGPRWIYGPGLPALILGALAGAWFAFEAGDVTRSELGGVFADAFRSVGRLALGDSEPKRLFQSGGQSNSTVERILALASVALLLVVALVGVRRVWRRSRDPAWRTLALVALLYPASLALRLTSAGSETSQRASEFVFVGLGFVAGVVLGERRPRRGLVRVAEEAGVTVLAVIVFLGGFIIGESPVTRQPGPFLVGGEARAVSPEGREAARFAARELPPGSRVLVDRTNSTLIGSYGGLDHVVGTIYGIPVTRVFFTPTFDAIDRRVVLEDEIDYIVVDRRLSQAIPANGYYYEASEPQANRYRRPISHAALAKFDQVAGLSRVFDNGAIAIYDTSGMRSGD